MRDLDEVFATFRRDVIGAVVTPPVDTPIQVARRRRTARTTLAGTAATMSLVVAWVALGPGRERIEPIPRATEPPASAPPTPTPIPTSAVSPSPTAPSGPLPRAALPNPVGLPVDGWWGESWSAGTDEPAPRDSLLFCGDLPGVDALPAGYLLGHQYLGGNGRDFHGYVIRYRSVAAAEAAVQQLDAGLRECREPNAITFTPVLIDAGEGGAVYVHQPTDTTLAYVAGVARADTDVVVLVGSRESATPVPDESVETFARTLTAAVRRVTDTWS